MSVYVCVDPGKEDACRPSLAESNLSKGFEVGKLRTLFFLFILNGHREFTFAGLISREIIQIYLWRSIIIY